MARTLKLSNAMARGWTAGGVRRNITEAAVLGRGGGLGPALLTFEQAGAHLQLIGKRLL